LPQLERRKRAQVRSSTCGNVHVAINLVSRAAMAFAKQPHPNDSDIDAAMSGNIYRRTTFVRVREAIKHAAQSTGQGR